MLDYIFVVAFLILFVVIILGIAMACFEDTDTFRAIDEKIAKFIRGKDDETD